METVSTSQLVATVAAKFDVLPKKVTKEVLKEFLTAIESAVAQGNKVRIDKVGTLVTRQTKARMGRNPQTGEELHIPARKKIAFRASKSLKELALLGKRPAKPKTKAAKPKAKAPAKTAKKETKTTKRR